MYLTKGNKMDQSLKTNIAAVLMLSIPFCANAAAGDCYEKSPNLINIGSEYYNLENTTTLSAEEKQRANNLFTKINGEWKGEATILECSGPDNAPKTKISKATVRLKANFTSNGSLNLNANKSYIKERLNRPESLVLLSDTPFFEFEFISNDHFIFYEKFRRMNLGSNKIKIPKGTSSSNTETIINKANDDTNAAKDSVYQVPKIKKNRISRITETSYDIHIDVNILNFTRIFYTNGVYIGEEQWQLRRP